MGAVVFVVMACAIACHGGDRCVPGQQRSCDCAGGLVGAQVCNADGAYGSCATCTPADAGPIDAPADARADAARPDAPPDAALAVTGAGCGSDGDCAGNAAACIADGAGFPGGYCTSRCDPGNADPQTGIDPDCPGSGLCVGGSTGNCVAACTAQSCRTGYACFFIGCFPASRSDCDPTVAGSCGAGQTCEEAGVDPVGICDLACDVFAQGCPGDANGSPQACYVVNARAEGGCIRVGAGVAGDRCDVQQACATGLACHAGACVALCGGPSAVACAAGNCVDFSAAIPSTTVGVCVP